jgi:hypothetical protein
MQDKTGPANEPVSTPLTWDEVQAWRQRITQADPGVVEELIITRSLLEGFEQAVTKLLAKIHPLSARFEGALRQLADTDDPAWDSTGDALATAFGVAQLYDIAGHVEDSLPDNCDCRVHGCARLAGLPGVIPIWFDENQNRVADERHQRLVGRRESGHERINREVLGIDDNSTIAERRDGGDR